MLGWIIHKLESRLLGEVSTTSDMQIIPTLMAESEEELKSHLMRVKEKSKRTYLNINIQKGKIMAYDPIVAAAPAKSLQSCLTLCNPIDGSPPGSSIPGILQAGILEWVAISFSITSWQIGGKMETGTDFYFLGLQNQCGW